MSIAGNKILRTEFSSSFYVITTEVDGVRKYISRHYYEKGSFKNTVLLNRAMRFYSMKTATRFIDHNTKLTNAVVETVSEDLKLLGPRR